MCHCRQCHQTFTTIANFDRHLTGKPDRPTCNSAAQGLVEHRPGVWGQPGPDRALEALPSSPEEAFL